MPHELDRLFRPRSVAVVGASENDPSRMGTRTLHDLVDSGWDGEVFPVSSRHDALYGRSAYRSLRELPTAPDVVLARTPSAGIEALVDDAIAARAGLEAGGEILCKPFTADVLQRTVRAILDRP